jgi:hypothetical protein
MLPTHVLGSGLPASQVCEHDLGVPILGIRVCSCRSLLSDGVSVSRDLDIEVICIDCHRPRSPAAMHLGHRVQDRLRQPGFHLLLSIDLISL